MIDDIKITLKPLQEILPFLKMESPIYIFFKILSTEYQVTAIQNKYITFWNETLNLETIL